MSRWACYGILAVLAAGAAYLAADREARTTLFATPDQQAQRRFDAGDFAGAAELFTTPDRRGAALYRAGEFKRAAAEFGRTGTPEGALGRGNALLFTGDYGGAIRSYEAALRERPGWTAAAENLALARARLGRLAPPEDQVSQKGVGEDDEPDEIVFDDRAKNRADAETQTIAGEGEALSDEAMRALWLRRVETKPADFLRRKFAYQLRKAEEGR
jgi:Ca-activated chloride channel family protein